jgi:aspartate aminotransferase-like enzyme/GNAT superfamily N-acetyltransferase
MRNLPGYNSGHTVSTPSPLRFKIADDPAEFEQIFQLGYDTFVEEIPQHAPNGHKRHVDRFHDQNTYIVARQGDDVVGMIALRGERPFSLDQKLDNLDEYLPSGRRVCELRLLAVRPEYRRGVVFKGLVDGLVREGRQRGFDLAVISGTLRQTKLYRHLGFVPFGPRVGTDEAPFQPMYITFEDFLDTAPAVAGEPASFLPGPVPLTDDVRAAFQRAPAYHRDQRFREEFSRTRARLSAMVGAPNVQILLGSGTLANDTVAGQISLLDAPGIVVSNGEFGERLIDQARRMGIVHLPLSFDWGEPLDYGQIARAADLSRARWLWAVACETSTGMLNDLDALKAIARQHQLALCLDCVSAIGAVPLDLSDVFLASGASGKALASFPGLSFVFHAEDAVPQPTRLPRYLDLGYYAEKCSIPFTHSSNLIAALDAALERFDTPAPFEEIAERSSWLRARLREFGLPTLVPDAQATPAVVTIPFDAIGSAAAVGDALQQRGLLVAYQSEYLARRNWLQIGLMGGVTIEHLDRLVNVLRVLVTRERESHRTVAGGL